MGEIITAAEVKSVNISLREELAIRTEMQNIERKLLEEANALQERVKNLRTQANRLRQLRINGTGSEQPR